MCLGNSGKLSVPKRVWHPKHGGMTVANRSRAHTLFLSLAAFVKLSETGTFMRLFPALRI